MSHFDEDNNIVSVDDPREITILFKGKLQFQYFKQLDNIYVLIALHTHKKHRIIKIMSYSFSLHVEAKRLFVKYDNMNAIIEQEDVQKRFQTAISTVKQSNPNAFRNESMGKYLKSATHETMVAYLLDHLVLSEYNQSKQYYSLSILSDKGGYEESDSSDADALEVTTTHPPYLPKILWSPPVPIHDNNMSNSDNATLPSQHTNTTSQLSALFECFHKPSPSYRIQPTDCIVDQNTSSCSCSSNSRGSSSVKVLKSSRGWGFKPSFSFFCSDPTASSASSTSTDINASTGSMKTAAVETVENFTRIRAYSSTTTNSSTTPNVPTATNITPN